MLQTDLKLEVDKFELINTYQCQLYYHINHISEN